MPTTYTPNPNNDPVTYQLPSDLDAATAESINAAIRALADKNAHAYQVFAQLSAANVFDRGQLVNELDAGIPLLATGIYPTQHPGEPGNKWKIIFNQPTNGTSSVAFYAGSDPNLGHWCLSYNARWIVSRQAWEQQDSGRDSFALIQEARQLSWRIQPAGQTTRWAAWPIDLGPGIPSANFSAAGAFNYVEPKPRTTYVKMGSAFGDVWWDGVNHRAFARTNGSYVWWELDLPPDAVLVAVTPRVLIPTPVDILHLTSRSHGTWNLLNTNAIAVEAHSELSTITVSAVSTNAAIPFPMPPGGILVEDAQHLAVRWLPHSGNAIDAIRLDWLDPGPRNR